MEGGNTSSWYDPLQERGNPTNPAWWDKRERKRRSGNSKDTAEEKTPWISAYHSASLIFESGFSLQVARLWISHLPSTLLNSKPTSSKVSWLLVASSFLHQRSSLSPPRSLPSRISTPRTPLCSWMMGQGFVRRMSRHQVTVRRERRGKNFVFWIRDQREEVVGVVLTRAFRGGEIDLFRQLSLPSFLARN